MSIGGGRLAAKAVLRKALVKSDKGKCGAKLEHAVLIGYVAVLAGAAQKQKVFFAILGPHEPEKLLYACLVRKHVF